MERAGCPHGTSSRNTIPPPSPPSPIYAKSSKNECGEWNQRSSLWEIQSNVLPAVLPLGPRPPTPPLPRPRSPTAATHLQHTLPIKNNDMAHDFITVKWKNVWSTIWLLHLGRMTWSGEIFKGQLLVWLRRKLGAVWDGRRSWCRCGNHGDRSSSDAYPGMGCERSMSGPEQPPLQIADCRLHVRRGCWARCYLVRFRFNCAHLHSFTSSESWRGIQSL